MLCELQGHLRTIPNDVLTALLYFLSDHKIFFGLANTCKILYRLSNPVREYLSTPLYYQFNGDEPYVYDAAVRANATDAMRPILFNAIRWTAPPCGFRIRRRDLIRHREVREQQ